MKHAISLTTKLVLDIVVSETIPILIHDVARDRSRTVKKSKGADQERNMRSRDGGSGPKMKSRSQEEKGKGWVIKTGGESS